MSSENGDQVLPEPPVGSKLEAQKKSKISYSRDFLLSLSELDICKKLPSGFDASILSEFGDASITTFELQRSSGGLSLQSSKKTDYGSLPQNRLESSSYNRGNTGRWDTRSTGSSDRDGDLQSEKDALVQESGRRLGNQTRRFWQQPEHDGLLGSGAFPRPSGYAGASAPKARGNGHYQLSRSSEPYQPPRPYKAGPSFRKDSTDSYNDETFGSTECSSQDRAEEERKRRESFELMRKEQQKSLQEKQKPNFNNHKENLDADIFALLKNSEDVRNTGNIDKPVDSSLSHNDSSRSSIHIQASASRPLVPPGFASALIDKNLSTQSSSTSLASEVGSVLINHLPVNGLENNQEKRNRLAASVNVDTQTNEYRNVPKASVGENEKLVAPSSSVEVIKQTIGFENVSSEISSLQEANEVWEDDIMNDLSRSKEERTEIVYTASQDHSTILEKLFSSALSKNSGSSHIYVEHQGIETDEETWSSAASESSKFARCFHEEEKKPVEDFSSRDLLSLIVNNEKTGSQASISSIENPTECVRPSLPLENNDTASKLPTSPPISSVLGIPEQYSQGDKQSSVVLTCEDLEQSILAEVNNSGLSLRHSAQGAWNIFHGRSEEQKADVNDHASHHLLSLLQKGTGSKESVSSPRLDVTESSYRFDASDEKSNLNIQVADSATIRNSEEVRSSDQTLILESLFGASFMNALHSVEAPVSAQRGSAGTVDTAEITESHGSQFPRADDNFFPSTSSESRSNQAIHGDIVAPMSTSNDIQKAKVHDLPGPWTTGGYGDSLIEPSKLGDLGNGEGAADFHLPEEDSLITVGDSLNPMTSDPSPLGNANKTGETLPENTLENLSDKLLDAILRDGERLRANVPDSPPLHHASHYEMNEPDSLYHHLHGRPSQFPHQINQTRPLFPQVDHLIHRNPQMKFIGPDGMRHDPHHPFPTNVIPHHPLSNVGAPRFDPIHHPMLQHMPVPGNFPQHHPIQGLPRGVSLSHPFNHMPGYVPELNNVHAFPLHHRPNYSGGLGMGMPGSAVGGSGGAHPEALERLIEMEMRANSKQIRPAGGGYIHGIYGPELDMNFRYR